MKPHSFSLTRLLTGVTVSATGMGAVGIALNARMFYLLIAGASAICIGLFLPFMRTITAIAVGAILGLGTVLVVAMWAVMRFMS